MEDSRLEGGALPDLRASTPKPRRSDQGIAGRIPVPDWEPADQEGRQRGIERHSEGRLTSIHNRIYFQLSDVTSEERYLVDQVFVLRILHLCRRFHLGTLDQ
ncbi:hypothetical protein NDU88_006001 [Pleurodeles waltl]|uniref:Uncharacterized protein n=1 Tax=Pleurodeles waltl TaxID=8319 RepID=A0AAV7N110_PLEWA|nr:hypothetical protein NDU88_006001 [Pleurodeles waltl]